MIRNRILLVVGVVLSSVSPIAACDGSTDVARSGNSTSQHTPSSPMSGSSSGSASATGGSSSSSGSSRGATDSSVAFVADSGATPSMALYGNPNGHCTVPAAAQAEDVSHPTTVVGDGTAASCTSDRVAAAVRAGGVVTFGCGLDPITIAVAEMDIVNDGGQGDGSVTIDGGGKITLSGSGDHRIIYQNTCDQNLHWTTSHCNAQSAPHLVVQNIAFTAGKGAVSTTGALGGGAIYVGGGTFKAFNTKFFDNSQPTLGQDYAGAAIYTNDQTQSVYIVGSTFQSNSGSNGGALGSIGTSWTVLNSAFLGNTAIGTGENPARAGTPGGGLGGAIYNDGNGYTLTVCGTDFSQNTANELGTGSIFFVADDLKGTLTIDQATFVGNSNNGSVQSSSHPSIYVQARDVAGSGGVTVTNTTFN
jgi:hypothetical protein